MDKDPMKIPHDAPIRMEEMRQAAREKEFMEWLKKFVESQENLPPEAEEVGEKEGG